MARQCEVISGFLMRHPCDYPAVGKCIYCKKRTCGNHARDLDAVGAKAPAEMASDESTNAVVCTECIKERHAGQDRWRDDPYFYGMYYHPHYRPYSIMDDYDEADHAAFEREPAEAGAAEGEWAGT